jgi:undecaprenyl phosphate N,N'-diacetylbacillosamine 1-phosphate transferase
MNFFFNLLLAVFILPIFIIFFLIIALFILLLDGFPILYIDKRLGLNYNIIKIYKFRTMKSLKFNDKILEKYSDYNRVTKIGFFLRKTSLDEIPQLLNIFMGDMSFVGPRPLPVDYKEYIVNNFYDRSSVKPGITGLTQIKGRNKLSWKRRFYYDNFYVKKRSLKLDLFILLKTIFLVLSLNFLNERKNIISEKLKIK